MEQDAKAGKTGDGEAKETSEREAADSESSRLHTDKHLFANPYAVLAEIADGHRQAAECQRQGRRRRADVRAVDRRIRRRSLPRSLRARFLVAAGGARRRDRGRRKPVAAQASPANDNKRRSGGAARPPPTPRRWSRLSRMSQSPSLGRKRSEGRRWLRTRRRRTEPSHRRGGRRDPRGARRKRSARTTSSPKA